MLIIFIEVVVVEIIIGRGVAIVRVISVGVCVSVSSGRVSVCRNGIGGSGDVRMVVRVKDINTASMNTFIRKGVVHLFGRAIGLVTAPRRWAGIVVVVTTRFA